MRRDDASMELRASSAVRARGAMQWSLASVSAFGLLAVPWALLTAGVGTVAYFVAMDVSSPMTLVVAGVLLWGWALYSRWVFRRLADVGRSHVLRRRLRALGSADVERLDLSHLRPAVRRLLLETRGLRAELEDLAEDADPSRMLWEWLRGLETLPEGERQRFEGAGFGLDGIRQIINDCVRDRTSSEPRRRLVDRLARLEELMLQAVTGYR